MEVNNKFRFFAPVDFLEKGKDKKGNEVYKVGGIISDSSKDADGENLDPNGFDFSEFNYINWNHGKSPSDIIGEPETWKMTDKGVYMEGYIYPDSVKGMEAVDLMKTLRDSKKGNHLGWSVEGQVLERDLMDETKVKKARITAVALCPFPKNGHTFAELLRKGFTDDCYQEDKDLEYDKVDEEGNLINETNEEGDNIIVDKDGNVIVKKAEPYSTKEYVQGAVKDAKQNVKENLSPKSQSVANSSALIREDVEGNPKENIQKAIITIVKAHQQGLASDEDLKKCLKFKNYLEEK